MHMPTKKYFRKKNGFNGSNCDRKSQLSGILTEPSNPRGLKQQKKLDKLLNTPL